ncbi:MAG: nitroreductase [Bacteroidetes bacterium]|nr:nitroreductase [Bacteroidota bacterium]
MDKFNVLQDIITSRRSTKPAVFNGRKIDDQQIQRLLTLATWAPTHANTEPWRFIVYSGDAVRQFCQQHAQLYRQNTPPEKFNEAKYEKQQHNGDKASHLIAVYMQRGANPNITGLEEICATAAAVQNILLGAEALGLAVLWSTGGVTLAPAMKDYLGLHEEDHMIGLLYLGYTDEPAKPGRRLPAEAKTKWIAHLSPL